MNFFLASFLGCLFAMVVHGFGYGAIVGMRLRAARARVMKSSTLSRAEPPESHADCGRCRWMNDQHQEMMKRFGAGHHH